jgi:hypothetical protein
LGLTHDLPRQKVHLFRAVTELDQIFEQTLPNALRK